jgi:hypothetical protein
MIRFLSPADVLARGISYLGTHRPRQQSAQIELFREHYGTSHVVLANIWKDLTETLIEDARLDEKEKTEKGLKMFLIASFFLFTYPKNRGLIQSRFNVCKTYCGGKKLWHWVSKIAALKARKIYWDPVLDDPNSETFVITIDGTDKKMWEPTSHPRYNVDKGVFSKKFAHAAQTFEIGLSIYRNKIVWISGPHRAGKGDLVIFREGLKYMIANGKLAIVDLGYQSSEPDEQMLSVPSHLDSKELYNFKSRARLRHETLNGRIAAFKSMSDTFRHGKEKMKLAFEAVAVIVQYQMDNGEGQIYSV